MRTAICIALATAALWGCAANISPDTYSVGSVGQVNRSVTGVIISMRPVAIAGTSGAGGTVGAGAGAVAGSAIGGNDRANILGAIGGAVVGGLAGAAVEGSATKQSGYEYVVQSDHGALLTIVQGGDALAEGTKVIVIYGSPSRLIRDPRSTP